MYYPCSENKGADQLRDYREADLRLCFRICRLLVFTRGGSFLTLLSTLLLILHIFYSITLSNGLLMLLTSKIVVKNVLLIFTFQEVIDWHKSWMPSSATVSFRATFYGQESTAA